MNTVPFKYFGRLFLGFCLLFLTATAPAAIVTLSWNANQEPNIAGYRVHYGTVAKPYSSTVEVTTTTATIPSLKMGDTYTFAVTAFNTDGAESAYSTPVMHTVGSSRIIPPSALANISSRTQVGLDSDVLIGGFIIEGIVAKKVALRAIGPSLSAFGVVGALSDPVLQVVDSTGAVVVSNDNWNVPGQEISSLGLAPTDGREAAIVATLEPGAYTAIVSGKDGSKGVALFDLYDLDTPTGRVANISTRSLVQTDDNVLIGGFILGGQEATEVIVRAIGPSLGPLGVTDVLADPTLELYDSEGSLVASNDNWRSDQEAAIVNSGIAPTDDREAAVVETLAPGAYTGVLRGAKNTTGVALIEVFALNE
ncbi:MAG TPA: fibronectin type III domain-containing protein [Chthoniobacterales bacterium]